MTHAPVEQSLEIEIAAKDEMWRLVHCPRRSGDEWQNIRLYGPGKKKRKRPRSWNFGWNGSRVSRCRDFADLYRYAPAIYQWVISTLNDWENA